MLVFNLKTYGTKPNYIYNHCNYQTPKLDLLSSRVIKTNYHQACIIEHIVCLKQRYYFSKLDKFRLQTVPFLRICGMFN